jgi:hypothetical protein
MRRDFFVELSKSRPTAKARDVSLLGLTQGRGDGRSAVAGPGVSPRAGASDYFEGPVFRGL